MRKVFSKLHENGGKIRHKPNRNNMLPVLLFVRTSPGQVADTVRTEDANLVPEGDKDNSPG